ncbi:MAG: hypothetical protein AAFP67_07110, partial [Pseudomonadota bacterium]
MTGNAGDSASNVTRPRDMAAAGDALQQLRAALSERVIPSLVEQARRDAPVPDDAMRDMVLRYALRG